MGKVIDKIIIRDEDIKIRKNQPPVGKVFKDKKKYNRNEKHKKKVGDGPLFYFWEDLSRSWALPFFIFKL
jgi:hypothetical protein